MLVKSEAGSPAAVFFDPTGRRRRAFRAALVIVLCAAAALVALILIGLFAQASAPRTLVGLGAPARRAARSVPSGTVHPATLLIRPLLTQPLQHVR